MIIEYKIKLDTIEKVKKFTSIVKSFENDIDIMLGRYIANAKSEMAILSLDLHKALKVVVHDARIQDVERLEEVWGEFRVDD